MIAGNGDLGQDIADVVERCKGGARGGEEAEEADQRQEGRDVAHLRAQQAAILVAFRDSAAGVTPSPVPIASPHAASNRRSLLISSLANSRTTAPRFMHDDAVGERQNRLGLGREDDDGKPLRTSRG